jgi:hypothetical protein
LTHKTVDGVASVRRVGQARQHRPAEPDRGGAPEPFAVPGAPVAQGDVDALVLVVVLLVREHDRVRIAGGSSQVVPAAGCAEASRIGSSREMDVAVPEEIRVKEVDTGQLLPPDAAGAVPVHPADRAALNLHPARMQRDSA